MLVLMWDLRFKSLQLIQDYVGLDMAMHIVAMYDWELLMPFLLIIFQHTLIEIWHFATNF
jgi:hypothetical protein